MEVLLALSISVLLMAALYVTVDVEIRNAQAGRERVDDAVLARSLLQRIRSDVSSALSPISAGSTSATSGDAANAGAAGAAASSTVTTASLDSFTSFGAGLRGDGAVLTLWVTRLPGMNRPNTEADTAPNGGPDIHRVSYWLAGDLGLVTQDVSRITANDDATQMPPDVMGDSVIVVAPEVVSLAFLYFDGSGWIDNWDGTQPSDDGTTLKGPPRAVKVVIGIKSVAGNVKTFENVIAIQTANAQPAASTTSTTGASP